MAVGNLSGVALAAHGSCTDASNTAKLEADAVDASAIPREDAKDAKYNPSIKSRWAISVSNLCEGDRTMFQIDNGINQLRILGDIIRVIEDNLEKKRKSQSRWRLSGLNGKEIAVRDVLEKMVGAVRKTMAIADAVVSIDPTDSASPWAGVKAVLLLCLNASDVSGAILEGLEVVIRVISWNSVIEALHRREESVHLQTGFETGPDKLYKLVLAFLCLAKKHYARSSSEDTINPVLPTALGKEVEAICDAEKGFSETQRLVTENLDDVTSQFLQALRSPIPRTFYHQQADQETIGESSRQEMMCWMSSILVDVHLRTARQAALPDTGRWILESTEFVKWRNSSSSESLWIYGIAGSGKTTILSQAIEHLRSCGQVAHFYCSNDLAEPERCDATQVLRSFVKQLTLLKDHASVRAPAFRAFLKKKVEAEKKGERPSQLEAKECVDLICELCETTSAILVIDSLDECSPYQRDIIIDSLDEITARAGDVVKVLIASRYDPDIAESLQGATHIEITSSASREDMHLYIETVVSDLVRQWFRMHQESDESKEEMSEKMITTLTSGANGVFLWVKLQMQLMDDRKQAKCCRVNIDSTLGQLQSSLDATYTEILRRISALDGTPRSIAMNALKWLLCSRQQFNTEQFILAIGRGLNDEITVSRTALVDYCCGLVLWDVEADCFRLCHPTLREYLLDRTDDFSHSSCNLTIAETCIRTYVGRNECESEDPIRSYATQHWPFHVEQAQAPHLNSLVVKILVEEQHLEDWMDNIKALPRAHRSAWNNRDEQRLESCVSSPASPLFVACSFGFNEILDDARVQKGLDLDGINIHGASGLYLAARWGQVKVVNTLVKKGVDVNVTGGHYNTPLLAAAVSGYPEITKLLVEHGAESTPGDSFTSPLHAAIAYDHDAVIETLIRSGVQLKDKTDFKNALDSASARGNYIAVENLLSGAAGSFTAETTPDPLQVALFGRKQRQVLAILKDYDDINQEAGTYGNALQAAIAGGDVKMVKLVVEAGADLNIRGRFGYPLRAAVALNHFRVAKYFLEQQVDPNIHDEELGDVVQTAASVGNPDMIKLLLSYRADVDGRGGYFGNALQAVCYLGNEQIAKLLVDNGAKMVFLPSNKDITKNGLKKRGQYHNALHAAIHGGHERIINLLMTHQASDQVGRGLFSEGLMFGHPVMSLPRPRGSLPSIKDAQNWIGRSHHDAALSLAIKLDSSSLIECLLTPNHSPGSVGYRMLYGYMSKYSHPLEVAAYWGSRKATRCLLKRGYDANTIRKACFVLHIALERSQFHVADELLSQGAEIDKHWRKRRIDRELDYGSCLQLFSETGNYKAVEYLLDKGADVNDSGGDHGTALQVACGNGHIDVVKLLLDRGADVHDRGHELGNALAAAAGGGHEDTVLMLLERHAELDSLSGEPREVSRELLRLYKRTALQAASASGHASVVTILLERGASINGVVEPVTTLSKDEADTVCPCSPLILASYYGHLEVVSLLLQHGADITLIGLLPRRELPFYKDQGSMSPLEIVAPPIEGDALLAACSRGFIEIARQLFMADPPSYIQRKRFAPALAASLSRPRTSTIFESKLTYDEKELPLMLIRDGLAANLPLEEFGPVFEHGDMSLVEMLVEGRALAAHPLLLLDAARGGKIQIVTKLLSSGMDVNTTDELGRSALEFAVNELKDNRFHRRRVKGELESRFEVLSTLLRHGADVSKLTEKCHVITTEIVERGRLDLLLRFEAGGCRMFPQQQGLSSALSAAISKGHVDMVGHIVDTQKPGDTDIDRALRSLGDSGSSAQEEDEVQIARLLLAARSSRVVRILPQPVERAASNKHFSLCHALITEADHDRDSYIDMLKETARDHNVRGYTHFIWRRVDARPDKLLIYNSAITAFAQSMNKYRTGNYSLLHMLLQGADSNIRNRSGESLLYHAATCQGQEERVKLLLHFRADMRAITGEHGTALHGSAFSGSKGPMKVLLNAGADIDALNEELESPLILTLKQTWRDCPARDHIECLHCCAKLLIEAGADINIRCGEDGMTTPASAAISAGNIDAIRILLDNSADVLEGIRGPDKIKDACEAAGLCQHCRESLCPAVIKESKACTHMLDLLLSLGY